MAWPHAGKEDIEALQVQVQDITPQLASYLRRARSNA
jgi:hypothetical protein